MNSFKKNQATCANILNILRNRSQMDERIFHLMEWMERPDEHKKYFDSYLCFQPNDIYFRFIKESKFKKIPIIWWENYDDTDKECFVKDRNGVFHYLNVSPFTIIISKADWVFNNSDQMKIKFYEYMNRSILKEDNLWQINSNQENRKVQLKKINPYLSESKPLF